jgi:Rieske Fe-S protein
MNAHGLGRRHAIAGAAGIGLGLPVLAACGGEETAGGGGASTEETSGQVLLTTSEVPVEGGTVIDDPKVVVTQPTEGEFKAFSSICTHQGCPVSRVQGAEIQCGCHGSVFSASDGSVVNGPATSPLEELAITVDGDEITLA